MIVSVILTKYVFMCTYTANFVVEGALVCYGCIVYIDTHYSGVLFSVVLAAEGALVGL